MCWNANVSLNTFLFSGCVLALIIYNNSFTQYKIQELNNKWVYFLIASFVFMQLIEFFIWKNINNPFYNNMFSICATLLILVQPVASIMIVTNVQLRTLLLISYLLPTIPYSMYAFSSKPVHSVVSKSGHLNWQFIESSLVGWMFWLFFFLFSIIYEKMWVGLIFAAVTLIISGLNYKNDNSIGSMWCWSVNSCMIYYAIYLLMYLPFLDKRTIC